MCCVGGSMLPSGTYASTGATTVWPSCSAMRAASTRTRTLCLPSARCAPFCSVPPIGSRMVVVPCAISSRNSTDVSSSSQTLAAAARSGATRVAQASSSAASARCLLIVAAEDASEQAAGAEARQQRPFLATAAALRSRGEHTAGQAGERQALQPDRARPGHAREEQAFAAEQRCLHFADVLDLEVDARRVGHHAAGIDHQRLPARELALDHRAAGVHEGQAVALELLHDEALAAEEADAQLLLERDAERHAARRAQERILLAQQRAAEPAELHRQDLARVRRAESDALLGVDLVGVDGREQRLPVSNLLPAPSNLPNRPPWLPPEPSPNTASIEMPGSMKNMLPASPMAASPGRS